jgi:hypothetical protein
VVESVRVVVFGAFLLVAGLAMVRNPLLGEFAIGHAKIERAFGYFFGVLSIVFGAGLVYVGL